MAPPHSEKPILPFSRPIYLCLINSRIPKLILDSLLPHGHHLLHVVL